MADSPGEYVIKSVTGCGSSSVGVHKYFKTIFLQLLASLLQKTHPLISLVIHTIKLVKLGKIGKNDWPQDKTNIFAGWP